MGGPGPAPRLRLASLGPSALSSFAAFPPGLTGFSRGGALGELVPTISRAFPSAQNVCGVLTR